MGDMAPVVMRTTVSDGPNGELKRKLEFVKVSDAAPDKYKPIQFSVKDLGGSDRTIIWGNSLGPTPEGGWSKAMAKAFFAAGVETVPKKRTKRVQPPKPKLK